MQNAVIAVVAVVGMSDARWYCIKMKEYAVAVYTVSIIGV